MIFNSINFLIFLLIVFILYWIISNTYPSTDNFINEKYRIDDYHFSKLALKNFSDLWLLKIIELTLK